MRTLIFTIALLGMTGSARADMTRSFVLHRWGFNLAGKTSEDVAYNRCRGLAPTALRKQRTRGDLAYTILSFGFYTPQHVTVECLPPTTTAVYRP